MAKLKIHVSLSKYTEMIYKLTENDLKCLGWVNSTQERNV